MRGWSLFGAAAGAVYTLAMLNALSNATDVSTSADGLADSPEPRPLFFTRPTGTLPVSLTGTACALDCAHCGGHYLAHMRSIAEADAIGYRSLLISGGCDAFGRVPITRGLEHVERLRPGRRLNWHVGFSTRADLERIAPLVDVISFDIVGDRATAQEVYGLDVGLDDYLRQLALLGVIAPVVPHLTLGLRAGRISGELAALEALAAVQPERLILLILIPTPGTRYATVPPPALTQIADLFTLARHLLPQTQLILGCMRPHGRYRQQVDRLAIESGLDGLVNPSRCAEELAAVQGRPVIWGDECCALP